MQHISSAKPLNAIRGNIFLDHTPGQYNQVRQVQATQKNYQLAQQEQQAQFNGLGSANATDYFELNVQEDRDWDAIRRQMSLAYPELYKDDIEEFLSIAKNCVDQNQQRRVLRVFGIE